MSVNAEINPITKALDLVLKSLDFARVVYAECLSMLLGAQLELIPPISSGEFRNRSGLLVPGSRPRTPKSPSGRKFGIPSPSLPSPPSGRREGVTLEDSGGPGGSFLLKPPFLAISPGRQVL